ncbi:hypothetical protein BDD12DRAFT_945471 [Trichophaea hybrida]|nr:hypothetical protein BDD12DRAFT_945471 [Trichophaea hybrida]
MVLTAMTPTAPTTMTSAVITKSFERAKEKAYKRALATHSQLQIHLPLLAQGHPAPLTPGQLELLPRANKNRSHEVGRHRSHKPIHTISLPSPPPRSLPHVHVHSPPYLDFHLQLHGLQSLLQIHSPPNLQPHSRPNDHGSQADYRAIRTHAFQAFPDTHRPDEYQDPYNHRPSKRGHQVVTPTKEIGYASIGSALDTQGGNIDHTNEEMNDRRNTENPRKRNAAQSGNGNRKDNPGQGGNDERTVDHITATTFTAATAPTSSRNYNLTYSSNAEIVTK